jgi:hypothetical protein
MSHHIEVPNQPGNNTFGDVPRDYASYEKGFELDKLTPVSGENEYDRKETYLAAFRGVLCYLWNKLRVTKKIADCSARDDTAR